MTFEEFFQDRADWFDVLPVQTENGYDVVLRLDGSYMDPRDAAEMTKYFRNILNAIQRRNIQNSPSIHKFPTQ